MLSQIQQSALLAAAAVSDALLQTSTLEHQQTCVYVLSTRPLSYMQSEVGNSSFCFWICVVACRHLHSCCLGYMQSTFLTAAAVSDFCCWNRVHSVTLEYATCITVLPQMHAVTNFQGSSCSWSFAVKMHTKLFIICNTAPTVGGIPLPAQHCSFSQLMHLAPSPITLAAVIKQFWAVLTCKALRSARHAHHQSATMPRPTQTSQHSVTEMCRRNVGRFAIQRTITAVLHKLLTVERFSAT